MTMKRVARLSLVLASTSLALSQRAAVASTSFPIAPCKYTQQAVIGGGSEDRGWALAVDAAGNSYLAGMTESADFPATAGVVDATYEGNGDGFVVKLDARGRVVWATYLGGSSQDQISAVAVDSQGAVYLDGYTFSSDFPTTPGAFDTSFGGSIDAWAAKISADGTTLVYATFLGGAADDFAGAIAVDAAGRAVVTGYSESSGYPTTFAAYDQTYNGGGDVVVTKLLADGAGLAYSTFVGGSSFEGGYGVAIDLGGNAFVSGITSSTNFPTSSGAFQKVYGGGTGDAFVIKVGPGGAKLVYATYLGSTQFDDARGLAVDVGGHAYAGGRTESVNYPTTPDAYDRTYNGGRDAFLTKLTPDGTGLAYSTFMGGAGEDETGDVVVDAAGNAWGAGWTDSPNFPTTSTGCQHLLAGFHDAFLYKLSPQGDHLLYGSYFGEPFEDYARGVGLDGDGHARIGGYFDQGTTELFWIRVP